jgi:hypothetical protein
MPRDSHQNPFHVDVDLDVVADDAPGAPIELEINPEILEGL